MLAALLLALIAAPPAQERRQEGGIMGPYAGRVVTAGPTTICGSAFAIRLTAGESAAAAWHTHCGRALSVHRRLATTLPTWYPPANLQSWTQLTHPVPSDERAHG